MTDFNRTVSAPGNENNRMTESPRATMTTTGPIFSRLDVIAGIAVAVMTLMPSPWRPLWLGATNRRDPIILRDVASLSRGQPQGGSTGLYGLGNGPSLSQDEQAIQQAWPVIEGFCGLFC